MFAFAADSIRKKYAKISILFPLLTKLALFFLPIHFSVGHLLLPWLLLTNQFRFHVVSKIAKKTSVDRD